MDVPNLGGKGVGLGGVLLIVGALLGVPILINVLEPKELRAQRIERAKDMRAKAQERLRAERAANGQLL